MIVTDPRLPADAYLPLLKTVRFQNYGGCPGPFPRPEEEHHAPIFKELFIDADADDLAAEQDRRHRVRRSRRARPAMIIWPAARNRENRSRL